jgi:hypothetical protein
VRAGEQEKERGEVRVRAHVAIPSCSMLRRRTVVQLCTLVLGHVHCARYGGCPRAAVGEWVVVGMGTVEGVSTGGGG